MQESHKDKMHWEEFAHNCQRTGCKWEQTEIETSDIETGEQFKERMKRSRVTQGITTGFHRLGKYLKTPEQIESTSTGIVKK